MSKERAAIPARGAGVGPERPRTRQCPPIAPLHPPRDARGFLLVADTAERSDGWPPARERRLLFAHRDVLLEVRLPAQGRWLYGCLLLPRQVTPRSDARFRSMSRKAARPSDPRPLDSWHVRACATSTIGVEGPAGTRSRGSDSAAPARRRVRTPPIRLTREGEFAVPLPPRGASVVLVLACGGGLGHVARVPA